MTQSLVELTQIAQFWMQQDPDPKTVLELKQLIQNLQSTPEHLQVELEQRFGSLIEFGTAGLRGPVKAGSSCMNLAVIVLATLSVAEVLNHCIEESPNFCLNPRSIVLGYDARLTSYEFAKMTARVFSVCGFDVLMFAHQVPTPILAYAVTALAAAAGVIVTASHNPSRDNGYKLYWAHGAQITPPIDDWVMTRMRQHASVGAKDLLVQLESNAPNKRAGCVQEVSSKIVQDYLDKVVELLPNKQSLQSLRVAYTPLHGVGGEYAALLLKRQGLVDLYCVTEQFKPDGHFKTTDFPNPEEEQAMTLLMRLCAQQRVDVGFANDPDADRMAMIVPQKESYYVRLTGNEIGVLLFYYLINFSPQKNNHCVVASVVSTRQIKILAEQFRITYADSLTGFKWIMHKAAHCDAQYNTKLLLGFEEALGFCVGTLVRDKDGLSALLLAAEMMAYLKSKQKTVLDWQCEIAEKIGLFVDKTNTYSTVNADKKQALMEQIKRLQQEMPRDFLGGQASFCDYKNNPPKGFLPSSLLEVNIQYKNRHVRILLRPSGTEPKFKIYVEQRTPVCNFLNTADYLIAKTQAQQALLCTILQLESELRL